LAWCRTIIRLPISAGAVGDGETTFLSDGAVHDGVAGRSTDQALVRFEDAEGLAPKELRCSFTAVGAREVVGGFVHLGGPGQWVGTVVGTMVASSRMTSEQREPSGLGSGVARGEAS
jgi:hypothetical protein